MIGICGLACWQEPANDILHHLAQLNMPGANSGGTMIRRDDDLFGTGAGILTNQSALTGDAFPVRLKTSVFAFRLVWLGCLLRAAGAWEG